MQDVLFAFRQMRHQWGATAIAVITLGFGLGASLAVFTLVNAVLLRPLPYPEPDRLMSIGRGPAESAVKTRRTATSISCARTFALAARLPRRWAAPD